MALKICDGGPQAGDVIIEAANTCVALRTQEATNFAGGVAVIDCIRPRHSS